MHICHTSQSSALAATREIPSPPPPDTTAAAPEGCGELCSLEISEGGAETRGRRLLQSQAGSGRKRLQSSSVRCQHPPHHSLPAQHRAGKELEADVRFCPVNWSWQLLSVQTCLSLPHSHCSHSSAADSFVLSLTSL